MTYAARILADSSAPSGSRATSFEITYPRFVHSELLTHRLLSRNSASSRAIPIEKMIEQVERDPAGPVWWGLNQSGMQARQELSDVVDFSRFDETNQRILPSPRATARAAWLHARDEAVLNARRLMKTGLHKQIVNRVLEPWMWITVIVTATEWDNFFRLRCHEDAQPEIKHIAVMMRDLYTDNKPRQLSVGEWHRPLIFTEDHAQTEDTLNQLAVGRCARVSFLTHDGRREPAKDVELHDRLMVSGHWSPFEHVARALDKPIRIGNFVGFEQYRALVDPNFLRI